MKKYYLYQITNLINGKIYIGVHQTENLEDGYMGSGSYLKRSIKKNGKDNFKKIILKFFDNEKEMYLSEAEIVTPEFIEKETNYNLKEGGSGGTLPCEELRLLYRKQRAREREQGIGIFSEESKAKIKLYRDSEKGKDNILRSGLLGCNEANSKKRLTTLFEKNYFGAGSSPNNGSICITNGTINKMIKKDCQIPESFKQGMTRVSKNAKVHYGSETNNFGKTWYTNGIENLFLKPDESVPDLFHKGRTQKSKTYYGKENCNFGKSWYTNGTDNLLLKQEEPVPNGFYKGRTLIKKE